MKKSYTYLFLVFFFLQIYSCKVYNSNLANNIKVNITKHSRDDCDYFCHYLNLEIINNNNVGIYLPNFFKYYSIINEKNEDISEVVEGYEFYNKINNGYLLAKDKKNNLYEAFEQEVIRKKNLLILRRGNSYKKNIRKVTSKDFQKVKNEAEKDNIKYSEKETQEIIEALFDCKYGELIYIPAKKSIIINKRVNYLFSNFILNEDALSIDGHGTIVKPSDSITNPLSYLYENYESNKTKKVRVIFNYKALPTTEEKDSIEFPINYFNSKSKKIVKISKNYPNKILEKYYLIKELKSKDTLTIKIK